MEFQSTGLGQRHLDISWQVKADQISTEQGQDVWSAVLRNVPLWLMEQGRHRVVVLRGETRLPVVWRYFSAIDNNDFENILRIALSREAISFIRFGRRRKLFLKLAAYIIRFFVSCVRVWLMRRGRVTEEVG